MAPTSFTEKKSNDDDNNDDNQALIIGLTVPLAIITAVVVVYFIYWKNSCGLFGKSVTMQQTLLDDHGNQA